MNVNSSSNSNNCKVVSKYFKSSPVMDESLSEFKEKKGGYKGPKKSQKPTVDKVKQKKLPKRIKGQKDIRAALKTKNNEQLIYAKEFDKVCKQAGIDVDSEQLQLAIALSNSLKSLEDTESSTSQRAISSQERTKKIRTTLQEYGFAVPEIKITNKRLKNHRKKYKLLLSTETEKQQIISDRYSQVLFRNSSSSKAVDNHNEDYSMKKCYYVATGIPYMTLRNNSIFCVENLVESCINKGNLLRDWSSIPGRPESPVKKEILNMNISEIECSQEELDIVLSGTLKSAKDVFKKKVDGISSVTPTIVIDVDNNTNSELAETKDKDNETLVNEESVNSESADVSKNKTLLHSDRFRSCSPDIFDDEVSLVLDSKNDTKSNKTKTDNMKVDVIMDLTQDDKQSSRNNYQPVEDRNYFVMDLTYSENSEAYMDTDSSIQTIKSNKPISQCSQDTNLTKRSSNDLMEIAECVGISASKINPKTYHQEISKLSQSSNKTKRYSDELMEVIECVANSDKDHQGTTSQVANKVKNISYLMEMTECVPNICIPLDDEADVYVNKNSHNNSTTIVSGIINNDLKIVDLSQSDSGDELPSIYVTESNKSLDDTIILNEDEIVVNNPPKSLVGTVMSEPVTLEHTLDLTDTPPSPVKNYNREKSSNKSFFDEFVHNHSDDTSKETLEKSKQIENDEFVLEESDDNCEVDLTQSSNSSVVSTEQNNCSIQTSKSSLGKKDEVSIDYDELYDVIAHNGTSLSTKNVSKSSVMCDMNDESDAKTESENISQNSEVFDISDKELEYSLNQSRHDAAWAVDYGGISVIDGDVSIRKSEVNYVNKVNIPNHSIDRSINDSFLPLVKVKRSIDIQTTSEEKFKTPVTLSSKEKVVTPFKGFSNDAVTIDTPNSNDYIVKTDQVTPILDYASMSTPERNKELNKYGLKPFKRKRAIQLLTHLYNQTHPIVESCQDLPSPSKRRKHSQPSPKKLKSPFKSPRKLVKSPIKMSQPIENTNEIENNIYEVTNEFPEIKEFECCEEDWVFQKREKAKIHSCRVPLHIALHNYVSCRRRLREAILRYDAVNIDIIHKELIADGHRYDPKDLLKYLDKKCITVKTADNNARNNKR